MGSELCIVTSTATAFTLSGVEGRPSTSLGKIGMVQPVNFNARFWVCSGYVYVVNMNAVLGIGEDYRIYRYLAGGPRLRLRRAASESLFRCV